MYRQANFLNQNSRKTLCSALIQCHLDYSCSSWYSGLTQTLANKLQVAQNKMVRFIKSMEPRTHIGQEELSSIGMLDVTSRVKQLRLNHVFKIYNNSSPLYLAKHFTKTTKIHTYGTRFSVNSFYVPKVQGAAANTFYSNAIRDWNSLPNHIQTTTNKDAFKKAVKAFLASN